jgi:hypothetical protein
MTRIFACALAVCCATSAAADHLVVNDRFIVAKDDVRGFFYRDGNRQTVLDIRWSDWSIKYRCNDEYDRDRVKAAMLNLVLQLDEARDLSFPDFLASEGFDGCESF